MPECPNVALDVGIMRPRGSNNGLRRVSYPSDSIETGPPHHLSEIIPSHTCPFPVPPIDVHLPLSASTGTPVARSRRDCLGPLNVIPAAGVHVTLAQRTEPELSRGPCRAVLFPGTTWGFGSGPSVHPSPSDDTTESFQQDLAGGETHPRKMIKFKQEAP